jgi:hypothetical protein
MSRRNLLAPVILAGCIAALLAAPASAQEKYFGKTGTVEIAGGISFSSITPVTNGKTGEATTLFSLGPEIGYFVADGFEIGFNPGVTLLPGVSVITPESGEATTILQLFAYPAYNLHIEGSQVTPFLQVSFGYTSMSSGDYTQSGFSWGIKGGIKVVATGPLLLTFYGQYYSLALTPENATQRSGLDYLSFGIGVGGFF